MDPNNNQAPQPPVSVPGQEPPAPVSPATPPVSDIPQEGVKAPTDQASVPPASAPTPVTPAAPVPGVTPPVSGPGTVTNTFGSPAVPISSDDGMPPAGMGGMSPAPKKKLTPIMIAIIAAVAVVILAVASYFIFFSGKGNSSANNAAQQSSNASTVKATDMAMLMHATLKTPATIGGYTSRNTGVATVSDFVSTDNTCELIVGTVTAAQLPGADLDAIVQPQIKQLKDAGATVVGPNAGTALILKDDSSKTYSMPTLTFEFSQGKKHATVNYSAVILKSGDRAIVNRTCINATGAVDTARLKALNDIALQVIVTPMNM